MESQQPDSSHQTHDTQGQGSGREFSNCLNAILVLLTVPLYILILVAAVVGMVSGLLAPGWLPEGLGFITNRVFFIVAVGLFVWFLIVSIFAGAPSIDYCGMTAAFQMFEDGRSGYLLLAGLVVAVIVLKLTVW